MDEQDVLRVINGREIDASDLLEEAMPNAARRFYRLTNSMNKLLQEVREHFPDALYYSASGTVSLLLGSSHDNNDHPVREMVAVTSPDLNIDGGDW
ncbi:hypothetical protein CEW44_24085 [Salmonella enterica subsp. enterica serovar Heidelberg]|uniref:Uncharacterized protein n=2 Tax=Salmonella enterica I TaxID=59201 RepID=A0A3V4FDS0_SALET|nr:MULTISPECIES: hypothetical protein [Enterobacteriaceae]EAW1302546.1 hypothetical protein [Salmonella enterica subsp. enterica]EBB7794527.1 hypothetical protein [Salmonella enterica subsp. enterica serovar Montevideo]EBD4525745.1 hypothetical protein [Salmonella enterica subsp. enterica serovar Ohio]EBH9679822.1 hypothetical protein [Salmonella enterica subsp. enterica serovar 4,[5],12:i:-]EBY0229431.1 hypothetical protein [Salmonella enterica subsp. enterica serovar Newport]ECI2476769.1 hy